MSHLLTVQTLHMQVCWDNREALFTNFHFISKTYKIRSCPMLYLQNLERKIEYGELPPDYKDPISGGTQDKAEKATKDVDSDSGNEGGADDLMDGDDLSSDDEVRGQRAMEDVDDKKEESSGKTSSWTELHAKCKRKLEQQKRFVLY